MIGRCTMLKVSVIVPCLNMRKYIDSCLKSIVNQTIREMEILVVDAGSTDGTLEILDEIIRTDNRVHLMHSLKKSYGYQVNLGIAQASGQYIAIVDADDRIAPDMYKVLYEIAVQSEADYVKGTARSFYTISEDFIYYMPLMQFPKAEYRNGMIEVVPTERTDLLAKDNFLWYGIFRHKFIKNVTFHESPGAAFQDFGGLLQTQMKASKAVYLEKAFYEYRQDNAGASGNNPKGFQFVWEEYSWAEQFIVEASYDWKTAFYRKLFLHTQSIFYAMASAETVWDDSQKYIRLIKEKLRNKLAEGVLKKDIFSKAEWANMQLLLEDETRLFYEFLEQRLCQKKQLADIMEKAQGKEIVIFGYSNIGTFVYAQIVKHGLGKVVAFCDNQLGKQGTDIYDNVSVLSPAEAVRLYADACFVVTGRRYFDEMKKQLVNMKVPQSQICIYTMGVDMRLFEASLILK